MIRVSNIDRSLKFYNNALGMRELCRESFKVGRFTLLFGGYGEEANGTVLELSYNWDEHLYEHGTGYGHLALEVADIYAPCERLANNDL